MQLDFHFKVGVHIKQKGKQLSRVQRVNTFSLIPEWRRLSKQQSSCCLLMERGATKPNRWLHPVASAWSCSSAPPTNTHTNLRDIYKQPLTATRGCQSYKLMAPDLCGGLEVFGSPAGALCAASMPHIRYCPWQEANAAVSIEVCLAGCWFSTEEVKHFPTPA